MNALMRPNPVRAGLQAGGSAYGMMAFEFFTPGLNGGIGRGKGRIRVARYRAQRGWHRNDQDADRRLTRPGIVPMVRVPGCHYHLIAPVLDAGAMGIMVPTNRGVFEVTEQRFGRSDVMVANAGIGYPMQSCRDVVGGLTATNRSEP